MCRCFRSGNQHGQFPGTADEGCSSRRKDRDGYLYLLLVQTSDSRGWNASYGFLDSWSDRNSSIVMRNDIYKIKSQGGVTT